MLAIETNFNRGQLNQADAFRSLLRAQTGHPMVSVGHRAGSDGIKVGLADKADLAEKLGNA